MELFVCFNGFTKFHLFTVIIDISLDSRCGRGQCVCCVLCDSNTISTPRTVFLRITDCFVCSFNHPKTLLRYTVVGVGMARLGTINHQKNYIYYIYIYTSVYIQSKSTFLHGVVCCENLFFGSGYFCFQGRKIRHSIFDVSIYL